MAAILRDSVVVVAIVVVRTRPRAIPLAMITMRKSIHGFPFLSYMGMGLRLAALRAAGAPLSYLKNKDNLKEPAIARQLNFYLGDEDLLRCRGRLQ